MPYFDNNPLEKLMLQPGDVEAELDLRGLSPEQAMQTVEQLLQTKAPANSYSIHFDAASDDGRETLFLPLGRRLLEARRAGHLARCLPLADGSGFFIAFSD